MTCQFLSSLQTNSIENRSSNTHKYTGVHSSTAYNSQKVETAQMSIKDEQINIKRNLTEPRKKNA
jgi:hypothetical protein